MQTEGSLEIGEYVVRIFTGIVFGDDAVRFDRRAGVARVADVDADAMRGFRESALRVAVTKRALADDVAVDRRMQKRRVGRCGSDRVDHTGQRAILVGSLARRCCPWLPFPRREVHRANGARRRSMRPRWRDFPNVSAGRVAATFHQVENRNPPFGFAASSDSTAAILRSNVAERQHYPESTGIPGAIGAVLSERPVR